MNLQKRILATALAVALSVTAFGMTAFAYSVNFDRGSITLDRGERHNMSSELDVNYSSGNRDEDEDDWNDVEDGITWVSSNTSVASIDRNTGEIRAYSSGTTQVTAQIPFHGSPSITVRVRDDGSWDDDYDDWNDWNDRWDRGDDYYDPYLDEWVTGSRYGSRYSNSGRYDEYGLDRTLADYASLRSRLVGDTTANRPTASRNTTGNLLNEIAFNRKVSLTKTADQATVVNAASRSAAARLDNYASVAVSTLHDAAARSTGVINFDTRSGGELVGRLQITPSKAASITSGNLQLGVHYMDSTTRTLSERFNDTYSNGVHVVMCDQGSFGMTVRLYVLLDADVNAGDLVFYSYNASQNSIAKLDVSGVSVDANGYVSFNTTYGGTILISEDGELSR